MISCGLQSPLGRALNLSGNASDVRRDGDFLVIQIKVKRGETIERALKRLKKIMDKEGMMKQLRANRYYEKPSEKRRKKSVRARARLAMR